MHITGGINLTKYLGVIGRVFVLVVFFMVDFSVFSATRLVESLRESKLTLKIVIACLGRNYCQSPTARHEQKPLKLAGGRRVSIISRIGNILPFSKTW